ncbi:uncharacterized protein LOC128216905 [Mya arenaria]|uniref:uncharacterized protein LOC128216905 n=1 Tax=Mya arenaria TaxID=6604 RepID=UPI0022E0E9B3|nr:uncharacterized protein LOC128216905 [Mya arenaria]
MNATIVLLLCCVYAVYSINPCSYGAPLANHFCGRGGSACPSHHYCEIAPDDTYAVCCPTHCTTGSHLLHSDGTVVFCGLGGVNCPNYYTCNVAPNDAWAVCCPN